MSNLANLKSACVSARSRADKYPDSQPLQRAYELAQRKVMAAERQLFCEVKEID
jgi:hypothetical protein